MRPCFSRLLILSAAAFIPSMPARAGMIVSGTVSPPAGETASVFVAGPYAVALVASFPVGEGRPITFDLTAAADGNAVSFAAITVNVFAPPDTPYFNVRVFEKGFASGSSGQFVSGGLIGGAGSLVIRQRVPEPFGSEAHVFVRIDVAPEPSSLVMSGLGIVGLAWVRTRRIRGIARG